jgi:hypothetical protein
MRPPPVSADQHGLFSRQQALEGLASAGAFERGRRSARLSALTRGVYTGEDLGALDGRTRHLVRARGLLLALGDSWVLARRSAAVLHGLPLLGVAPGEVQLTRPRTTPRVRSSNRHRHINAVPESERSVVDGIACTSVARTVFDLARGESRGSAVVVADAALRSGVPRTDLAAVVEAHRGWPGCRQARWAVAVADGRAESPLESLGRLACLDEDLPPFEPQVEVWLHGELLARVDGLWWDRLVVFEGDGAVKFDGPTVLPALLARQERLREAGLTVVRATWNDLVRRRSRWADGIRRELADNPGRLRPGVQLVPTRPRPVPLEKSDHYRWPTPEPLSTRLAAQESSEEALRRRVA